MVTSKYKFFLLLMIITAVSCKQNAKHDTDDNPADPHSFARPELATVKHLNLTISVDFSKRSISGKASWLIENSSKGNEIIFDASNLNITRVTLGAKEKETTFEFGPSQEFLGNPLKVAIGKETKTVNIYYTTKDGAAALQWLNPQQTAGKKHPYLFTQSESIAARSWIPCQDSPGIRFTYNAKVTVPKELLALMSAENAQIKNNTGVYEFRQTHAIPSYLLALAVGDIEFKKIDNRTGIYAEPSVLSKATSEFADMGSMVTAAEKLYGPYRWGRYDLLILPPSFPFGGMENPNLNFITPTIIAGDKSLVNIICHELAHSWSGNLVTNATWNDFWLNEGFTNYFERRIVESLYGKEEAEIQEEFARKALDEAVKDMAGQDKDTYLKTNYKGRNPDEGTNDIAYEKGYFFLKVIEDAVGRPRFDAFLKGYFNAYAFRSVTTEEFLDYLNKHLIKGDKSLIAQLRIDNWVYGPGIPSNIVYGKSLYLEGGKFAKIDALLQNWNKDFNYDPLSLKTEIVTSNEKKYFISRLPEQMNAEQMTAIDKTFNFTTSKNTDIQRAWYTLAIRNNYMPANKQIEAYLMENGRMWHIIPVYKELLKTAAGTKRAKKVYQAARTNYHPMTYTALDKLLR